MINALVLAGNQPIKTWSNAMNKALLRINGKMMIDYVIDALKVSYGIGKIVVVGFGSELRDSIKNKVDAFIESNGTIMQNVLEGIKFLGFSDSILICTSDIPLITPEAISDFIKKAEALKVDLCYPIVEKKQNDRKFPEIERTYVKMKEGTYTGGNIIFMNPSILEKGYELAEKIVENRKNPFKIAHILSFGFMVRLMLGILTIDKVEKKFSNLLGIKAKAVVSDYPEIGNDVDKPSDVIIASAHLSK